MQIIDAEFACIGPAGFDIGILLANYLFFYHADRCYPPEDVAGFHKTVILETSMKRIFEIYVTGNACNQTSESLCVFPNYGSN